MFALIISIIAIALVVALAGATLYYGGDAFSKGSARSTAAALVNQGQQIAGAWTLYKTDHGGTAPTATTNAQLSTALVGGEYLAAIPTAPATTDADGNAVANEWTVGQYASTTAAVVSASTQVCTEVAKLPGEGGIFGCEGTQFGYKLESVATAAAPVN